MKKIIVYIIIVLAASGCKKFLDEKSNTRLAIPSTIQDLQALLDYYPKVNQNDPSSGERSSDDYYLTYADWSAAPEQERRVYTWEKDNLFLDIGNDWFNLYENVYKANLVLSESEHITRKPGDQTDFNNMIGHALFIRGRSFFVAVNLWALAYDASTASSDMGIPLRLDPNYNIVSTRASVQQCYDRILTDLKEAAEFLPNISIHVLRPSKPAAYAILARTYLCMQQWDSAKRYCDLCLQIKGNLVDYNSVNAALPYPFTPIFSSPELIFETIMSSPNSITNSQAKIDSNLYASYATNDLRKTIYFVSNNNGSYGFKGELTGSAGLSAGTATDEVYLTRAECRARTGDITGAMSDLNTLMIKRWKSGFFQPFTASSVTDAVNKILTERRKELLMRGIRWWDIKRLNKLGAGISLTRKLNGAVYSLTPNHSRFALEIPMNVINVTGLPQNPR